MDPQNHNRRSGSQTSVVVMPQMSMGHPFDRISAIVGLAQQMGYPIPLQGNSQTPDFDRLMQLFSGDASHLAPLKEAARKVEKAEDNAYRDIYAFRTGGWSRGYHPCYERAIAHAKQIAALYGMDTSSFDHLKETGGFSGAFQASISILENRTKLGVLGVHRQLAQDAARNTATVFGTRKVHNPKVTEPLTSRYNEPVRSAERHEERPPHAHRHEEKPKHVHRHIKPPKSVHKPVTPRAISAKPQKLHTRSEIYAEIRRLQTAKYGESQHLCSPFRRKHLIGGCGSLLCTKRLRH